MSLHNGPFRCAHCLRQFDRQQDLKRHMRTKRHTVARLHRPEEDASRAALQTEHQRRVAEKAVR